ncbi:MAG: EVE domain-containing protein, partial [Reyranella sp.]|nr:EVE domain-containing protein [Reyranella sp.]
LLQAELAFTREKNWGYRLRQGLIEISEADMTLIAEAMFTAAAEPRRLAA